MIREDILEDISKHKEKLDDFIDKMRKQYQYEEHEDYRKIQDDLSPSELYTLMDLQTSLNQLYQSLEEETK